MERMQHVLADAALEGVHLAERYQIESKLGKGGMAWVYKGRKIDTGDAVAVKVLFSQLSSDESFRVRFLREAQIQFQLQHENIVRVYESFEDRGVVGFAMEWCDSGDLLQYLKARKDPLSWPEIEPLYMPLLDGLQLAHQRGVVHRDLKPQNVLLHREGNILVPRLTDFGIAKLLDASGLTKTGSMVGTLHYMSPEQVEESKSVDHRTDIYSMGVLLYVMATRKMPFSGQAPSLMLKVLREEPRPPEEAPAPLRDVILRCLEKNPDDRYADCDALKADLVERLGTTSDRISVMINSQIPPAGLPSIRPLGGDEFVSQDKLPSGAGLEQDAWAGSLPSAARTAGKSNRAVLWTMIVLSACAFLGFGYLQWLDYQDRKKQLQPPPTSPVARAHTTRRTPAKVVVPKPSPAKVRQAQTPQRKRKVAPQPPRREAPPVQTATPKPDASAQAMQDTRACEATGERKACVRAAQYWAGGPKAPRDAAKARILAKKACDGGEQAGCVVWATLVWRGQGGDKDESTAEAVFSQACDKANKQACLAIGILSQESRLYSKARSYFQKGCQEGSLEACLRWGWFWQNGWGGKQSYKRAGALYAQACKLGHGEGCNRLGVLQMKGLVAETDALSASELFAQACDKKIAWSCYNLGLSWYQKGQDAFQRNKAQQAMQRGCDGQHGASCYLAGVLLWNAPQATVKQREQAEKLFRRACQLEEKRACLVLGYIYTQSVERKRHCGTANKFLQRACQLGAKPCLQCPPRRRVWQDLRPRWEADGYQQKTFAR